MGLFSIKKKKAYRVIYKWCGENTDIVWAYSAEQAVKQIRRRTVSHVHILDIEEITDIPQ